MRRCAACSAAFLASDARESDGARERTVVVLVSVAEVGVVSPPPWVALMVGASGVFCGFDVDTTGVLLTVGVGDF